MFEGRGFAWTLSRRKPTFLSISTSSYQQKVCFLAFQIPRVYNLPAIEQYVLSISVRNQSYLIVVRDLAADRYAIELANGDMR